MNLHVFEYIIYLHSLVINLGVTILQEHFTKTGKEIKPVSRRKADASIDTSAICSRCNAPHQYLYDTMEKKVNTSANCVNLPLSLVTNLRKRL